MVLFNKQLHRIAHLNAPHSLLDFIITLWCNVCPFNLEIAYKVNSLFVLFVFVVVVVVVVVVAYIFVCFFVFVFTRT